MALDTLSLTVANFAIAASAVIALAFGVLQVRLANRDRRERLTIEIIRGFQTREFSEQMMGLRDDPPPTEAGAWEALDPRRRNEFVQFTQEMEMLGLLVYDGAIDLDLVERTLGNFVVTAWTGFKPGIERLRVTTSDPYLAEYFQWLAERVDERMRTAPRTPAYAAGAAAAR